jgi:SHS2 domain-containing protein
MDLCNSRQFAEIMEKYEILEHPADLKIRAYGRNLGELFTNTAMGMMEFLYGKDINKPQFINMRKIKIKSRDLESLLVDWLSEILYLSDANNRAYVEYNIIKIDEKRIEAEVGSCPAEAKEDIKAVTYNELKVEKNNKGWVAEVVFDV